jgi:sucrose phosphorylase
LSEPDSTTGKTARRMEAILEARVRCRAFHPNGAQRVIAANQAVFTLLRVAPAGGECVLALTNVSNRPQEIVLGEAELGDQYRDQWSDLLSDSRVRTTDRGLLVRLDPYQVCWLVPDA